MKIEEAFRKLKPVTGMDLDRLWREYILADGKGRRAIEDSLRLGLARRLDQTFEEKEVLLEPPPKELVKGEYPLGTVHYGRERFHPFGLRESEWVQHIGVFSRSGWGKTNVAYLIVMNLLAKKKPFLIFDWKRNYRDLIPLFPDEEILIYTAGRPVAPFSFNPLIPPKGTPPRSWLKKLIAILQHALFLGEGVAYLLQEAIDGAYSEFGVHSGVNTAWPTMLDVKEWLERRKVKGRQAQWMDSALRALGVLCFGETGRVLNQKQSMALENLLSKNAVIELDGLGDTDKTFFIEALLLWIHHYRMGQPERERFKHAILIEEAHHILLRKKQEMSGEEAVTDIILREIRELGEAVVLLDQHPSLISKPALGNTYTTIVGNLKHRSDINMIADSLLLDSKRARFLGKMDNGWAMVRLQGRWFEPFLVRFPLVKIKKGVVTDEQIRKHMAQFIKKDQDMERILPIRKRDASGALPAPSCSLHERSAKRSRDLVPNEKLLLKDIALFPASPVTERYERIGLNPYQGNKSAEVLLREVFIKKTIVPNLKGRITLLELTEKGKKAYNRTNERSYSSRHGGPVHQYWKKRLAREYRSKGWKVIEEYPIGSGRTVDLACFKDNRKLAIEVETGKSSASYNLKKAMDAGFDEARSINMKPNRQIT